MLLVCLQCSGAIACWEITVESIFQHVIFRCVMDVNFKADLTFVLSFIAKHI